MYQEHVSPWLSNQKKSLKKYMSGPLNFFKKSVNEKKKQNIKKY